MKPAFSEAFEPERLDPAPTLGLDEPITADWAWGGSTGAGVKVAVIDSGIDADHPAVGGVAGGVAVEYDAELPDRVRFDEGPHGDLYGHGTACAGIIRALAPDVELYSVRVLGSSLTGKARVFAHGVDWAIEHGMHVVNLSLSTTNDDWYGTFHDLADQAAFTGTMLVAAMANERKSSYPGEFSSVFSVAAAEVSDPEHVLYNPHGPAEWGATGIDVDVAWLDGATITATGNSFATPHVAGLIARIVAKRPGVTPFQVKTILAAVAANSSTRRP
ncbi:MAG TPA: S8 family serine peptidase [Acidimicrobiia bacterium]|nr:S8 family serine peptidase [Acidimicrobiia bacterium]